MASPLDILASLLDRSIEQIAAVSEDARRFDGRRIFEVSDVWDNNTVPLVAAATAGTRWRRSRLARTGLRWMSELRPSRRAWMVEMEPSLDDILPAAVVIAQGRDYQGRVRPRPAPLTTAVVDELANDYDLPGASVRRVSLQHTYTGLTGRMEVEVVRRYQHDRDMPDPAVLRIDLDDVSDVLFDAGDRRRLSIDCNEEVLRIHCGQAGLVCGSAGRVWVDDATWHLSQVGRTVDASTPARNSGRPRAIPVPAEHVSPAARRTASALHMVMLNIRLAGAIDYAATVPVHQLCLAVKDAGSDILTAGAYRRGSRERAFTELRQMWKQRGGDIGSFVPAPFQSGPAHVRAISYTAAHRQWNRQREAEAAITVAVPQPDRTVAWRLAGKTYECPTTFRVTTTAFHEIANMCVDDEGVTVGNGLTVR